MNTYLNEPKLMHVTEIAGDRVIACPLCIRGEFCAENANLITATLKTENERLREALEKIANTNCTNSHPSGFACPTAFVHNPAKWCGRCIAVVALEAK